MKEEKERNKINQLDYSKWIGRAGSILAIKGKNLLVIFDDRTLFYYCNLIFWDEFNKKANYEIISAEELKKGDVCILDNIRYEDTLLEEFLVFMGKEDDGDYVFNFLENSFGLEKLKVINYYQDDQKFKRFLRE